MSDIHRKVIDRPLYILDKISYVITIGVTTFLILYRDHMPKQVPMHWNRAGEIDRYSDPKGYIALVIFMYVILGFHALMMYVMPMLADSANFFKGDLALRATEEQRIKGARATLYMLAWTDVLMEAMFAYVIVQGIFVRTLGAWFVPVVFVVMGAIFVWYFVRLNQIQKEIV